MNFDTERSNRMFNLWMIAVAFAFVVGFIAGALTVWLVNKI